MYLGDYAVGGTINFMFSTVNSLGAASAMTGGSVAVYKTNGTSESTAGVTLTANFDSRTGLNLVTITTGSDGTFYSAGSDFNVVLTAGTVDGVSQAGIVLRTFSIENRASAPNAILDKTAGVETGVTLRQALRAILSASAAKLSGASTTSVAIRDVNDTKNRITATVDAAGNRSAVTLDLT